MAKLSKSKLLALISQEITNSLGFYSSDLAKQREDALKYYLGEPLGNEVEGRSSVVSQDLLEVVESMLPSLMRMFTQSDKMVNFEPQNAEDVPYQSRLLTIVTLFLIEITMVLVFCTPCLRLHYFKRMVL